jgi:hypothetical protein
MHEHTSRDVLLIPPSLFTTAYLVYPVTKETSESGKSGIPSEIIVNMTDSTRESYSNEILQAQDKSFINGARCSASNRGFAWGPNE